MKNTNRFSPVHLLSVCTLIIGLLTPVESFARMGSHGSQGNGQFSRQSDCRRPRCVNRSRRPQCRRSRCFTMSRCGGRRQC